MPSPDVTMLTPIGLHFDGKFFAQPRPLLVDHTPFIILHAVQAMQSSIGELC